MTIASFHYEHNSKIGGGKWIFYDSAGKELTSLDGWVHSLEEALSYMNGWNDREDHGNDDS